MKEPAQRHFAGGDWTGKSDGTGDLFAFCMVALTDNEAWNLRGDALRQRLGQPQNHEFHGHEMSLDHVFLFLDAAMAVGIRVGSVLITPEPTGALSHSEVALWLLGQFLPRLGAVGLWCDDEIQGKTRQQAFKTAIYRINRIVQPNAKINVVFKKSHTSNLIQLADVMAYVLSRHKRGALQHAALESLMQTIYDARENLIIGPVRWEELKK